MSGVRCQVSGVRCQVPGVRCQVSDVRCVFCVFFGPSGGASRWIKGLLSTRPTRLVLKEAHYAVADFKCVQWSNMKNYVSFKTSVILRLRL